MGKKQLTLDDAVNLEKMTLEEIRLYLQTIDEIDQVLISRLYSDPRRGTTHLAEKYERLMAERNREKKRIHRLRAIERRLFAEGCAYIAGADEAGRGALAGPVIAASVILPRRPVITGIDDSKKLTPKNREELYKKITSQALAFNLGKSCRETIDTLGIVTATCLAFKDAVAGLKQTPDYLLLDSMEIADIAIPHTSVEHGDLRCYSIAAASIVAKVERDRLMDELDILYPQYGFGQNRGYGTEEHRRVVEKHGYSPVHRRSFRFHEKGQLYLIPRS